ncbi:conserved exported hypothetical protein [Bacillus sp. 349Y]|nr:conserved exported hypothetical protein [Bacillus sp. 349Y]
MKKSILSVFIIAIFALTACDLSSKSSSEKLLDSFTSYSEKEGLDVLNQTIPQPTENTIIAVYKTPKNKLGIIEFDDKKNSKSEQVEGDLYTTLKLKGNYGNYIVVQPNPQKDYEINKVNLYLKEELVEEFPLESDDFFAFFYLDKSNKLYNLEIMRGNKEKSENIPIDFNE